MIASLSGRIIDLAPTSAVIDVNGVGYLVHINSRFSNRLSVGQSTTIATHLAVREDAMTLYGFENTLERGTFELLISVTGIGPKVAQSALNIFEAGALLSAIAGEEQAQLEKIPGLGKKGVARLILDLKEKVLARGEVSPPVSSSDESWKTQLQGALVGLGFTAKDASSRIELLRATYPDPSRVEISELLRAALAYGATQ